MTDLIIWSAGLFLVNPWFHVGLCHLKPMCFRFAAVLKKGVNGVGSVAEKSVLCDFLLNSPHMCILLLCPSVLQIGLCLLFFEEEI